MPRTNGSTTSRPGRARWGRRRLALEVAGINDDEAGDDVESSLRTSSGKDLAEYSQQRALVPVVESPSESA